MNEINVEDIIKSLIVCSANDDCAGCVFCDSADCCCDDLMQMTADKLKELLGKIKELSKERDKLAVQNELLRSELESCG